MTSARPIFALILLCLHLTAQVALAQVTDAPAAAAVDSPDSDAPAIRHQPVGQAQAGAPIKITATITDAQAIAFPRVYYRRTGDTSYQSITLEPDEGGFSATVPGFFVEQTGVEYYLEAFDAEGNGPAYHGNPDNPHRIAVSPASQPAAAPPSPFYSRWWFWTAVGVVAAAGLTTGLVLAGGDDAQPTTELLLSGPAPQPTLQELR